MVEKGSERGHTNPETAADPEQGQGKITPTSDMDYIYVKTKESDWAKQ